MAVHINKLPILLSYEGEMQVEPFPAALLHRDRLAAAYFRDVVEITHSILSFCIDTHPTAVFRSLRSRQPRELITIPRESAFQSRNVQIRDR